MNLKVITAPTTEPVSLDEAKLHCRVDIADDDMLIRGLITVAREEVERLSWHALMTQTLELVLDAWPHKSFIELPRPPLTSITSIIYKDSTGSNTTWTATNYIAAADHMPGRVMLAGGISWPSITLYPVEGIRIRYVAGYADAASVPQSFKQVMLLLIGHWYENREDSSGAKGAIPWGVDALLSSYRERARTR